MGCLFFYITYKTPLAGDDWGYALNGASANPFMMAVNFYNGWSGRFFSELWGFIAAPNKIIWNIVNPLIFVIIFLGIYYEIHVRKYYVLVPLLIIAVILSVDDNLRMETYTWLMGTTYTIPLALSFIYFISIEKLLFRNTSIKGKYKLIAALNNLLLFYIGLTMENIAAVMILAIILLLIYAYFHKKELIPYLIMNLVVSIVAFALMRVSPGSTARMLRDSADWMKMNFIEKIVNGYPSFLEFTFINNNYLILFLSLIMICLCLCGQKKIKLFLKLISLFIQFLAIIAVFSFVFIKADYNYLLDPNSLFSMLFWPIYTLDILLLIIFGMENNRRKDKALFFFMLGGSANLVMMYSPIFGSRSSIYTLIFMIVVMGLILESINLPKTISIMALLICILVIFDRFNEYIFKYRLVGLKQMERLEIIEYYKDHPEVEEAWIPRFPVYTIHGGDIDPGDSYHFETFKEYYQLPQDADKIIFYYEEGE